MKPQTLDQAIIEAMRFVKAAKAYRAYQDGVNSGAVKRASMDLTRKLADLRQGR